MKAFGVSGAPPFRGLSTRRRWWCDQHPARPTLHPERTLQLRSEMKNGEVGVFFFLLLSWELVKHCHAVSSEQVNEVDNYLQVLQSARLTQNLNEIVDLLLDTLRETLHESGYDKIDIPNIDKEFDQKVKFIEIKGKFHGEKGWFKNLASINRTSDAILIHSGENLTASVALGLATMEVGYDYCVAKIDGIKLKGKINGSAASNSIALKLGVDVLGQGKCNLTLEELKVVTFDGLDVEVTGLKPFNWLLSRITTSIVVSMKSKLVNLVEQRLSELAEKALSNYHCSGDLISKITLKRNSKSLLD